MMSCPQYLDQIAAHVDGALGADELARAQEHVRRCSACERKYQWEFAAKGAVKRNLPNHEPGPTLQRRIVANLDDRHPPRLWGLSLPTHALAAVTVLLLLIIPYYAWQSKVEQPNLFSDVAGSYRNMTSGVPEGTPAATPAATLLDLSPWGYNLLSKKSEQLDGRQGRVFVYQGQANDYLMAQEFDGSSFAIPDQAKSVRKGNTEFYTYERGGVNLVAWQEKDLLCILATSAPEADLLALAMQIVTRG